MNRGIICCGVLALAALGTAQEPGATIRRAHHEFEAASMKGDTTKVAMLVNKYMAKDFRYMEKGKVENRDQFISEITGSMQHSKLSKFKFTVGMIKTKGNTAMVNTSLDIRGSAPGKDKKMHKFTSMETDDETWMMMGGKWMIHAIKSTSMKMTMDGKPMKGDMGG